MDIISRINGFKSYIGLIITMIGMTGLAKDFTSDELGMILNAIFDIVGLVLLIVGIIHKDIKISDLKKELE